MTRALVIGATGTQGGSAVRALTAAGIAVDALVRKPDAAPARALAARGVRCVRGDLDDAASLRAAMTKIDIVFGVTDFFRNGVDGELRHGHAMIEAAKASGVGHFVLASAAGCDRAATVPHFASKHALERALAASGVPWSATRPGIFYEDLVDSKYVPPANWGMIRRLVGDGRVIPWTATADVGGAVAAIAAAPARHAGRPVTVVSDMLSIGGARAAYERVMGKRPFALGMPAALFSALVSRELVLMWQWLAENEMATDVEIAAGRAAVGAPPLSLEAFFGEHQRGARAAA